MREVGTPGSHGHVLDLHWWHLGSQTTMEGLGEEEGEENDFKKFAVRSPSRFLLEDDLSKPVKGWSSKHTQPPPPSTPFLPVIISFQLPTQIYFFFSEVWKFKQSYRLIPVLCPNLF